MSDINQSTENTEEETLEEKCQRLMQLIVKMRVVYPAHIAKINAVITEHTIANLKKQMKPKKEPKVKKKQHKLMGETLLKEYKELKSREKDLLKKQIHLRSIVKIENQLNHDLIGQIVRDEIDSATILKRAKLKMEENKIMN